MKLFSILRFVVLASSLVATNGFVSQAPQQHYATTSLSSVPNAIDTLTSGLASICRLPNGVTVRPEYTAAAASATSTRPSVTLSRLYDIENSRDCRRVRELLTELDLTVDCVVPAAPNARAVTDPNYEYALPNGASVPCLVVVGGIGRDEHVLSGNDVICNYLKNEFGISNETADSSSDSDSVQQQVVRVLNNAGSYVAGVFRIGRGTRVSPCAKSSRSQSVSNNNRQQRLQLQPLILYSYEGNQFCRLVREVLTELDVVYQLCNAGKQSPRRDELSERSGGSTQCPFLVDPNTDTKLGESADIIRYLYQQYASYTPPSELLQWVSEWILPLAAPVFGVLAPVQAGAWRSRSDTSYEQEIQTATNEIQAAAKAHRVLIYSYGLSPFSSECKLLLDRLNIKYTEMSLGQEWIPGLMRPGGAATRAALLRMTGQSSMPHVFVGGNSIGGLFSGTPGLLPALDAGALLPLLEDATTAEVPSSSSSFA